MSFCLPFVTPFAFPALYVCETLPRNRLMWTERVEIKENVCVSLPYSYTSTLHREKERNVLLRCYKGANMESRHEIQRSEEGKEWE